MPNQQRSFFKSRTWMILLFMFGIALLVLGLAEMLFIPVDASGTAAIPFVTFGFILVFLAGARLYRDDQGLPQDERTRKIGAYGLSWSWFLTFILLFGFFWLDYFGMYEPDAGALAVILILFMAVSARVFQYYLFRKGDVE